MRVTKTLKFMLLTVFAALAAVSVGNAQTYSGQATAAKVTVTALGQPVVTTAVADTGDLPEAGGNISLSSVGVSAAGILSVGSSNVSTVGGGPLSNSTASINNINIGVLSNVVTADVVSASTQCSCPNSVTSGNSVITNLRLNGAVVNIDGSANQTVQVFLLGVPVGTLIINEQIIGPRTITVNALHLFVTDPGTLTTTDVVIASARSGINCVPAPSFNLYSGRGTGVRLRQFSILNGDISTIVSDTGPLPTQGGAINVSTANPSILPPLLSTGVVTAATSGGLPGGSVDTAQSATSVDNLAINLLNTVTVGATVLSSNTQCSCSLAAPTCSGDSVVTNLDVRILGVPVVVNIDGSPNQVINIPVLLLGNITLIVNEQVSAGPGDITVNALRIVVNLTGLVATNVVIASSHSDMVCGISPSAAGATISGRVLDENGRGIARTAVSVVDGEGFNRTVLTNTFGNYVVRDVPSGKTYIVSAASKQYNYSAKTVSLDDNVSGLDFSPMSGLKGKVAPGGK